MTKFNLSDKIIVEQFHTNEDVDELAYLEIEYVKEFIRLLKGIFKDNNNNFQTFASMEEMEETINKLVGEDLI